MNVQEVITNPCFCNQQKLLNKVSLTNLISVTIGMNQYLTFTSFDINLIRSLSEPDRQNDAYLS